MVYETVINLKFNIEDECMGLEESEDSGEIENRKIGSRIWQKKKI
jgi:hypothetical protein